MGNIPLILASIFGYGLGAIFYKLASNHAHPIMTSAVMVGLYILLIPIAFFFFKVPATLNSTGFWFSLLGGACTCLGTLCYFFLQRSSGAGELAALIGVYPIVTVILSSIFLGEVFTIRKIIGCVLAISSILVLTSK